MENNLGYDRQDLTPDWPFFAVVWLVGFVVRMGHFSRVKRIVQSTDT